MIFFKKKTISYKGYRVPDDESDRISAASKWKTMLLMIISGVCLSMAFPPLNLEFLAFIAVAPLIVRAMRSRVSWRLFFEGYIWSFAWSICAFFWLREIAAPIPFALAAVLSLWGGGYALGVSFLRTWCMNDENTLLQGVKSIENKRFKFYHGLFFCIVSGAFFVALEFIRINMFPWNFIGVTQYKMLYLIQIVKYSGIYGISFFIVAVNCALALLWCAVTDKLKGRVENLKSAVIVCCIWAAAAVILILYGFFHVKQVEEDFKSGKKVRFGIIQGNLSQRRFSTPEMALEALQIYARHSMMLAADNPDIIIWPETAVPYPFYGDHYISKSYRDFIFYASSVNDHPFLLGTLDFEDLGNGQYGMTNSALLINTDGKCTAKYAKINRVPYGEFVPFREYLPESLVKKMDMGRDLTAGTDPTPLPLLPGVRAGMAICYESIFASLARDEANLGANMLLAINNDAWYPESSEPEQHVANAVFRTIETGLPALRCGNNGASVWILPSGKIAWSMGKSVLSRDEKSQVIEVTVKPEPEKTFYTRFGDVFLYVLIAFVFGSFIYGFYQYFAVLSNVRKKLEHTAGGDV